MHVRRSRWSLLPESSRVFSITIMALSVCLQLFESAPSAGEDTRSDNLTLGTWLRSENVPGGDPQHPLLFIYLCVSRLRWFIFRHTPFIYTCTFIIIFTRFGIGSAWRVNSGGKISRTSGRTPGTEPEVSPQKGVLRSGRSLFLWKGSKPPGVAVVRWPHTETCMLAVSYFELCTLSFCFKVKDFVFSLIFFFFSVCDRWGSGGIPTGFQSFRCTLCVGFLLASFCAFACKFVFGMVCRIGKYCGHSNVFESSSSAWPVQDLLSLLTLPLVWPVKLFGS